MSDQRYPLLGPAILCSLFLVAFSFSAWVRANSQVDLDGLCTIATRHTLAIDYPPMRALVCSKVWQHLQPTLGPIQTNQPRVMIAFSAVPGTGVSTCAQAIAHLLHGQTISSNQLRHILRYLGFNPQDCDKQGLPWLQYAMVYCLDQLDQSGYGVIVLDKTIDRTYSLAYQWCLQHGWKLRLIRLDYGSKQACLEVLSHHRLAQDYRRFFDTWWKDYERFQGPIDLHLEPIHPFQELSPSLCQKLLEWTGQRPDDKACASQAFDRYWYSQTTCGLCSFHARPCFEICNPL